MFNKDEYLKELEEKMRENILHEFFKVKYANKKGRILIASSVIAENTSKILSMAGITDRDVNYLMAAVAQYMNASHSSYSKNNSSNLPFVVKSIIERGTFADSFDDSKYLATLFYLTSTDNKYNKLATDVMYNYIDEKLTKIKITTLNSKEKFIEALDKVEQITSNENYVVTTDDMNILKKLYYSTVGLDKASFFLEIFSYCRDEIDYSLLTKFLKLDEKTYKNKYFNGKQLIENIKRKEYTSDELKFIKLLTANMGFDHVDVLEKANVLNYAFDLDSIKTDFSSVMNFIKTFDDCTYTDEIVNFKNLTNSLDLTRRRLSCNLSYSNDTKKIKYLYNTYRKEKFEFKFDEFNNYINSIKEEENLEKNIANCKVNTNNTDFDFYTFSYMIGSLSKSDILDKFAPYIPYLLETKSGREYFLPLIEKEKETIRETEEIYTIDTLKRLLPLAKHLSTLSDYTIENYLDKYGSIEDIQKFKEVCNWLRKRYKDLFKNSIDSEINEVNDRCRSMKEASDYFNSLPLKELNLARVRDYYDKTRYFASAKIVNNHALGRKTLDDIYRSVYKERIDKISLKESREFLLLIGEGKSLTEYIDTKDYDYNQAFEILSFASEKIDDKKALSLVVSSLEREIKDKERKEEFRKAENLVNIFKNSNFSSMNEFYTYISSKYNISMKQQMSLFTIAREDEELAKIIQNKKIEISEIQAEKTGERTRENAKKRTEDNIEKYGIEAVKAMRSFVNKDITTISNFCKASGISVKEFNLFRKVCANIDNDLTEEVNEKCRETSRKFVETMLRSSREIALEMKRCHKEKEPYDLYEHYEKYGLSPYLIANISSRFKSDKASKLINQYMKLHKDIFEDVTVSKIERMKRQTSIYNANFYLENISVSYSKKNVERAVTSLKEKGIPLCNGTLYRALVKENENNKSGKKVYQLTTNNTLKVN